jgi:hypothetical protein
MNDAVKPQLDERGMLEACLSDLTLDGLRLSELSLDASEAALAHLAHCARCQHRSNELANSVSALSQELPPLDAVLQAGRAVNVHRPTSIRQPARWWAPVAVALSAAAAVILLLGGPEERAEEIGLKGTGAALDLFVQRGAQVFRWQQQPLHPGDQVRYAFRVAEPMHVVVLSRDGRGAVSQYFPEAARSWALEAGESLSQTATELDDTLGNETLWAVFCRASFTAESFVVQLERDATLTSTQGCTMQHLEFRKEAP